MIVKFIKGQRQPWWYAVTAVVVSCLLVSVVGVTYTKKTTDHAVHKSEQNWCDIIRTLDDAYRQTPPQTEAGKNLAKQMHELRIRFECDKKGR